MVPVPTELPFILSDCLPVALLRIASAHFVGWRSKRHKRPSTAVSPFIHWASACFIRTSFSRHRPGAFGEVSASRATPQSAFRTVHKLNQNLHSFLILVSFQIVPGWPRSDRSAQIVGRRSNAGNARKAPDTHKVFLCVRGIPHETPLANTP